MLHLIAELKRRRVFRVAAAYLVLAWLLIQVASDVFPALNLPPWTVTLTVVLLLAGFPVALVLAWAFDITPEGVARAKRVGRELVPRAGQIAVAGAVIILALAGGAFLVVREDGVDGGADDNDPATVARTVAVLPFRVQGSSELAYLGEGLMDLISTDLEATGDVRAVDPHALRATLATEPGPVGPERGRELALGLRAGQYVLGSVFEVEGRVRITASLYDRSRGARPIDSRSVEGSVSDVLRLARELAEGVRAVAADAGSGIRTRLVWAGPDVDVLGSLSGDGALLSFTDWSTGDLALRDIRAASSRRLTDKGPWSASSDFAQDSRLSPDGRRVAYNWWDPNTRTSQLRVLELGAGAAEPATLFGVPTWLQPRGWTPDGARVLVQIMGDDAAHVLGFVGRAGGPIDTVAVLHGMYPDNASLSPDGRWVAYDTWTGERQPQRDVRVVAATGARDDAVVAHPADDALVGWTREGGHLVFWSSRGSSPGLWAVPIRDGSAAGEPVPLRSPMGWVFPLGFVGDDLYYGVGAGELQVHETPVDLESGALGGPPAPLPHAAGFSTEHGMWSPDGRRIAYVARAPRQGPGAEVLTVRDLATGAVREYRIGLRYLRPRGWMGSDRVLLFGMDASAGRRYYLLDVRSGATTEVHPGRSAQEVTQLVLSADGRTAFYHVLDGPTTARLVALDRESGTERVLATTKSSPGFGFALSPDGRWIALWETAPPGGLRVIATADGAVRRAYPVPVALSAAWSPDGQYLVYITRSEVSASPPSDLWRLRLSDGEVRRLHSGIGFRSVHVHPDGRRLAFTAGELKAEVWVMEGLTSGLK